MEETEKEKSTKPPPKSKATSPHKPHKSSTTTTTTTLTPLETEAGEEGYIVTTHTVVSPVKKPPKANLRYSNVIGMHPIQHCGKVAYQCMDSPMIVPGCSRKPKKDGKSGQETQAKSKTPPKPKERVTVGFRLSRPVLKKEEEEEEKKREDSPAAQ